MASIRRNKNKTVWTEELIIKKLSKHFLGSSTVRYFLNNLYVFSKTWESDYLALTKSGYLYEGEVKISKSDFKADFKKEEKHMILEGKTVEKTPEKPVLRPHYFFYAVPEGLVTKEEVPEYAGLVYMVDYFPYYKWEKEAPCLHKEKYSDEELNLQEKFYYNMITWKERAQDGYREEINNLKTLLKEAKTDENGERYPMTLGEYRDKVAQLEREKADLSRWLSDYSETIMEQRRELRELRKSTGKV